MVCTCCFSALRCLLLMGATFEVVSPVSMVDFKMVYYGSRCLLQHSDPYNHSEVQRVYRAAEGESPSELTKGSANLPHNLYTPAAFSFTIPFAIMAYGPAHILWMVLTAGGLILASFLMWDIAAPYAPVLSGCLIGFLIANSELPLVVGNPAGISVGLCVVAVWCFVKQRFVPVGVLCFAVSLILKPHDVGLVWLYFLLAGGASRKHAWQTLLVTIAVGLPGLLWVSHVAPHWMHELHSTLSADSARGGPDDPGPASSGAHGLGMMISLQTVISVLWDDPRVYNTISYLICGALLLPWAISSLRLRSSPERVWFALAAIAPLFLLPLYHRQSDATLLLLTVPACAILWAKGGVIGRVALIVNTAGFILTGDLTWAAFLGLLARLHLPAGILSPKLLIAVQVFPAPLILLVMGIFYLYVYLQNDRHSVAPAVSGGSGQEPLIPATLNSTTPSERPGENSVRTLRAVADTGAERGPG